MGRGRGRNRLGVTSNFNLLALSNCINTGCSIRTPPAQLSNDFGSMLRATDSSFHTIIYMDLGNFHSENQDNRTIFWRVKNFIFL